ncbi:MAG: galactose-1-phosphate uridylyltransferase [Nanoarchaeota archaeon]
MGSDLRQNPITGEWVFIATDRSKRPDQFEKKQREDKEPVLYDPKCPFCPGNEGMTPESDKHDKPFNSLLYYGNGNGGWVTRGFPNKFRFLSLEESLNRTSNNGYTVMGARGAHEVIVETPTHTGEVHELALDFIVKMFRAYQERAADLRNDPFIKYISLWKNAGKAAGASLSHPHSQLAALPFNTDHNKKMLYGLKRWADEHDDECGYCAIGEREIASGERVISVNGDYVAYAPFWSESPFTVTILPRTHREYFEEVPLDEVVSFSEIVQDVMGRISHVLDTPNYNWWVHNAPVNLNVDEDLRDDGEYHFQKNGLLFHWKFNIRPKLNIQAGFEYGTHMEINPTAPELAAQYLREKKREL